MSQLFLLVTSLLRRNVPPFARLFMPTIAAILVLGMLWVGVTYLYRRDSQQALYKRDTVVRQWSESISALRYDPLFPPRQDFQVGDLFLVARIDQKLGGDLQYLRRSLLLGYVDLSQDVADFYNTRFDIPGSGRSLPDGSENSSKGNAVDSLAGQRWSTHTDHKMPRLSAVAFPGFSVARVNAAQASGLIPFASKILSFDSRQHGDEIVSIRLGSALEYSVPAPDALAKLKEFCLNPSRSRGICFSEILKPFISTLKLDDRDVVDPVIILITDVVLASSIEYTYGDSSSFDLLLGAGSKAAPQDRGVTEPSRIGVSENGESVGVSSENRDSEAPLVQQASLDATSTVLKYNGQIVSLIEKFSHPLAVGYRAIAMTPLSGFPPRDLDKSRLPAAGSISSDQINQLLKDTIAGSAK